MVVVLVFNLRESVVVEVRLRRIQADPRRVAIWGRESAVRQKRADSLSGEQARPNQPCG